MANTLTSLSSLPMPIYEAVSPNDLINLLSAHNSAMALLESRLAGIQTAATVGVNASVVDTGGRSLVLLQMLSSGCIATIIGAQIGRSFHLLFQSVGSIGLADAGVFNLAGAFNATLSDVLTLVWDGTNYNEIARSLN